MAVVQIVVHALSGEQLATLELQSESTVNQLRIAVFTASPTFSVFSDLIFDGVILNDGSANLATLGLTNGSAVQLVAKPHTATLGGHNFTASVKPCDVDEFNRRAGGNIVQQFDAASILTIIKGKYTSGGRLCGHHGSTQGFATEEAILSLVENAGTASGFSGQWSRRSMDPGAIWAEEGGHTHNFLVTGHMLTLVDERASWCR